MPLITDSVGRVLGRRYRLVSALGTGASAHVYLAQDVTLQRDVAVKVLQPGLSRDAAFLKRFGAEARAAASLNHPHVLRVFDWGEDDGPYLVLEFLGGGSLRDLLDRRVRLTHAQAARLGRDVADGLAYAHGRGLVHRDIKPANLLFDEEGRVRIADFGVARALAEAAWTEPAGAMIGTARYASPEQAEGRPVDGRADVYSLALVLYETLSGMVPFSADTTVATLMARVGAPLPWHPSLGPLGDVLARAADPDHARRLDAVGLSAELAALSATLPEPEPLPVGSPGVARAAAAGAGAVAGAAVAGAVGGNGASATVVRAGPGEVFDADAFNGAPYGDTVVHDSPATAVMAPVASEPRNEVAVPKGGGDGTAVAVATPPPVKTTTPAAREHRRRRWPFVVLVVAVLLIAGAAFAAVSLKLFTPSQQVPAVTGLSVASARAELAARHLDLNEGTPVYSVTRASGDVVSQSPAAGSTLKQGSAVQVIPSKGPPPVPVPSLTGLDCPSAQRVLAVAHLVGACPAATAAYSTTVPQGQVINWSYDNKLDARHAPFGSTILMAVSKGLPPVPVPTVTGANSSYQSAAQTLQQAGLTPTQGQQYSNSVPQGEVIGTDPAVGTSVPHGSTVTVIVSEGPPFVTTPDVSGETINKAESDLQNAGLTIGQVYGPNDGTVFATDPAIGSSVQQGTTVNIYTEPGPAPGPGNKNNGG